MFGRSSLCSTHYSDALPSVLQPSLVQIGYDPFFRQKAGALTKSMAAAADIAAAAASLLQQQQAAVAAAGCGGQQQLAAHFSEEAKGRLYELLQVRRDCWCYNTSVSSSSSSSHLLNCHQICARNKAAIGPSTNKFPSPTNQLICFPANLLPCHNLHFSSTVCAVRPLGQQSGPFVAH